MSPRTAGATLRLALMGEDWGAWAAWYLLENKIEDHLVRGSVLVSQHAILADRAKQGESHTKIASCSDPLRPSPSARTERYS